MSNLVNLDLNLNYLVRFRTDNNEMCALSIFKGMLSFVVFGNKAGGRPIVKVPITDGFLTLIRRYVRKCIDNKEKHSVTIDNSMFNFDSKAIEYSGTVIIGRDDEGKAYLHLKDKENKAGILIYTKLPGSLMVDSKPIDDRTSTEIGLQALLSKLTHEVPVGTIVTSDKRPPKNSYDLPVPSTGSDVPF